MTQSHTMNNPSPNDPSGVQRPGQATLTDRDAALDTAFDRALRQALHADSELADDGFSSRVMAALPGAQSHSRALTPGIRRRAKDHLAWAHLAALSTAGGLLATLWSADVAVLSVEHQVATAALLGLLAFWAVPNRLSRG